MKSVALALLALVATPALAQDRPAVAPTRDVDVTYRIDGPHGPLFQRLRWATEIGRLRIDPPSPGLYVIIDTRSRRTETVRDAEHSVLQVDGATLPSATLPSSTLPTANVASHFTRRGTAEIAGLACTQWETADADGQPTLVCLTIDGVLLRAQRSAQQGGRVLVEATQVQYGPQDSSLFRVPANYRRVIAPPLSH